MKIMVRVNGTLAQKVGVPRFPVELEPDARVNELLVHLSERFPNVVGELAAVVVVSGGAVLSETALLKEGQDVALLLPVAGG